MFAAKQIVWAKTKGYPWWPAQINKIPSPDHNYFKVCFVGQNNHALLQPKAVKKYLEHYAELNTKKYKGLQNSIELANIQTQKRKVLPIQSQQRCRSPPKAQQKSKRIKKKSKKSHKAKKHPPTLYQPQPINLLKQPILPQNNQPLQTSSHPQNNIPSPSISQTPSLQAPQPNQLEYMRNIDRKKIQDTQEELFGYINRINSNSLHSGQQCFQSLIRIQKLEFTPQELLQSKITNMLSYICNKMAEGTSQRLSQSTSYKFNKEQCILNKDQCIINKDQSILSKEQLQHIIRLTETLKQKVIGLLFDSNYYNQYLKRIHNKQATVVSPGNQHTLKLDSKLLNKKSRKYKRKGIFNKKINNLANITDR